MSFGATGKIESLGNKWGVTWETEFTQTGDGEEEAKEMLLFAKSEAEYVADGIEFWLERDIAVNVIGHATTDHDPSKGFEYLEIKFRPLT